MKSVVRLTTLAAVLLLSVCAVVAPQSFVQVASSQQGNLPPPNRACPSYNVPVLGQWYQNGTPGTVGSTNGLEPEMPIWCYTQPPAGPATRILSALGWTDSWDNSGPAIQTLADTDYDYRVFRVAEAANAEHFHTGTFINSDHWMLDLQDISPYRLSGGLLVSPNHTFPFNNGTFAVEADAAAGSDAMGGADAFYEIDVTPAVAPTGMQVDSLYGYGSFGGVGAVGCRLERQADGPHVVCSMYDNTSRDAGGTCMDKDPRTFADRCTLNGPGRVWETQGVGTGYTAPRVEGGTPNYVIPGTNLRVADVWRQCGPNEHDLHCRDRFRLELTRDSLHLLVNGYLVFRIDGLYAVNPHNGADNRIPASWLSSGVRPYFTSWVNNGQHNPVRWHWNDVVVNSATPGASISFCAGAASPPAPHVNTCAHNHVPGQPEVGAVAASQTSTPTLVPATSIPSPTPSSTPTPSPSPTPLSTATPTPSPHPTETVTVEPSATATLQIPTDTPTAQPTNTPQPTPTNTPMPTSTATPPVATGVSCEVNVRIDGVERGWVLC
jgi:hypothetical protein